MWNVASWNTRKKEPHGEQNTGKLREKRSPYRQKGNLSLRMEYKRKEGLMEYRQEEESLMEYEKRDLGNTGNLVKCREKSLYGLQR